MKNISSDYKLLETDSSFCPNCCTKVHLLISDESPMLPAFYICSKCLFIGQVGKGRVKQKKGKMKCI